MTEENIVDHRKIGVDHELFFFNEHSPGSCFWLPNGTKIFNKLMNFIRDEYYKRGFLEVMTPVICKEELWKISGHLDKYKENMFSVDDTEEDKKEIFYMSSMNCPKHCLMFNAQSISYKQLPLRYADFGALHRKELRGALNGLKRGYFFRQDDSHIFCTPSQIKTEIKNCLDFLTFVYSKFGFKFEVALSTRPDKYIGDIALWDKSEKELAEVLSEYGLPFTINEKDGAFYGNKIDVRLTDSLGRKHQCATIQLDFNLPQRFGLEYVDENNTLQMPIMIHRAIYGSFERFIAILLEHYEGKLPLWLNWNQIAILPVTEKFNEYAHSIKEKLMECKYYVDVNDTNLTLPKKIAIAELDHYNYILVVGQKEVDTKTVNIRYRDSSEKKMISCNELIIELENKVKNFY